MSESEMLVPHDEQETAEFEAVVLPGPVLRREMKDLRVIDRAGDDLGWRIEADIDGVICVIYQGKLSRCIRELAYREELFASTGYYE